MDRSMQENRSIAPGLGAFRLTLQSRENGFCGYVYSAALGCRAEFTSLARLIVLLEEWMNTATDSPEGRRRFLLPQRAGAAFAAGGAVGAISTIQARRSRMGLRALQFVRYSWTKIDFPTGIW